MNCDKQRCGRSVVFFAALIGLLFMNTDNTRGDAATTQPADPSGDPVIVNTLRQNMTAKNRPSWSTVTSAAVLKGVNSGHFDRHYHDCNEYWLICKGKAKIWIDGKTYYVKDGDIVCTKAGQEHDVLELYEPLVGYHFEDATPAGGRTGHLHRTEADAKGHDVPMLAVPADFPTD